MNCLNTVGAGINIKNKIIDQLSIKTNILDSILLPSFTDRSVGFIRSFNNKMYSIDRVTSRSSIVRELNNFTAPQPSIFSNNGSIGGFLITPSNKYFYYSNRRLYSVSNDITTEIAEFNGNISSIYQTSTHLYVAGTFTSMSIPTSLTTTVAVLNFSTNNWSAMAGRYNTSSDNINNIVMFKNKIYSSTRYSGVSAWNGTTWDNLFINGYVSHMIADDNNLYVTGTSTFFSSSCIASYNGSEWTKTYGLLSASSTITNLLTINSKLYVSGNFTTINGLSIKYLAVFRNNSWSAFEGTIIGNIPLANISNVVRMVYSNNIIYVF
jgi:hypothetical protein